MTVYSCEHFQTFSLTEFLRNPPESWKEVTDETSSSSSSEAGQTVMWFHVFSRIFFFLWIWGNNFLFRFACNMNTAWLKELTVLVATLLQFTVNPQTSTWFKYVLSVLCYWTQLVLKDNLIKMRIPITHGQGQILDILVHSHCSVDMS